MTFVEDYFSGHATVDDIDDYVELWHGDTKGLHLQAFLGLTMNEYRNWVVDPETLKPALDSRRNHLRIKADEDLAHKRRRARGDARYDDEGYQYGVRFTDGSVRSCWNGSTQRQRAEEDIARMNEKFAPDSHELVRRKWGQAWSPVRDFPPAPAPAAHALAGEEHPDLVRLRQIEEDARIQGYTEGDINHHVQPIIGMLRLRVHRGEAVTGEDIEYAVDRLTKACLAERAFLLMRQDDKADA